MAEAHVEVTAPAIETVRAWAAAAGLVVAARDLPALARAHEELRAQAEVTRGKLRPSDEPVALDLRTALNG